MTEAEILTYARAFKSIWTLEILLFLNLEHPRAVTAADLVRDMRASPSVVSQALQTLMAMGLVTEDAGSFSFSPASPILAEFVAGVRDLHAKRPMAVTQAIFGPDDAVRQFADAFRIRKDPE
jgi:hypothetical protein